MVSILLQEWKMNNSQFSNCYKCSQPEKYVEFVGSSKVEVKVCVNRCKVIGMNIEGVVHDKKDCVFRA